VNALSVENLIEAAKNENLEAKIVIVGKLPGFVSLTDILQENISSSKIDFRCMRLTMLVM